MTTASGDGADVILPVEASTAPPPPPPPTGELDSTPANLPMSELQSEELKRKVEDASIFDDSGMYQKKNTLII